MTPLAKRIATCKTKCFVANNSPEYIAASQELIDLGLVTRVMDKYEMITTKTEAGMEWYKSNESRFSSEWEDWLPEDEEEEC